jgi:bacterioferritin-associated ferredoxin
LAVNRVYVCSCFGITEQQVRQHADDGRCSPRQIASSCKAGTDCGSCVKRIQALLGRGAGCGTRTARLEPAAEVVPAELVSAELVSAEAVSEVPARAELPGAQAA